MAKYMVQAAYSQEGLKGLVKDGGTGRRTAIEAAIKGLGGRLESLYFAFDESDVYGIFEAPDNISAAAFALAVGPTGALSHFRTVVLLTPEDVDQAVKKAAGASYRAPGH